MADEIKIDTVEAKTAESKVAAAAETVKAPVVEAAKAVETAIAAPVRKVRAKIVKRQARKAPAKVIEAAVKMNKRAVKRAKPIQQKAAEVASTNIERTTTMTYDFTKLFAGFELPGTDRFQTLFADAGERGQELVERSQKTAAELAEIAKANVEALTESGRIAAAGARTLGQDMLASGREGFEQASAAVKTLADVKSPTELVQIQSELARASFDRAVTEGSKFAEAIVKLAGEAIQPLSTRATLNAERMGELAA